MTSYASPASDGLMSLQKVSAATTFAKDRVAEFQENLNEGSWSLRILASVGALAMIIITALGIGADILGLNGVSVIFGVYGFFLGIVIIVLEYGKQIPCIGSRLETSLYTNARFLKFVWGRGCLLFFAGTVELAQNDVINDILGCYLCLVGIVFILVGRSAAKKMEAARKATFTPEQIQKLFNDADKDGKGSLSRDQFSELTKELGMDLTRREVESAFRQLDWTNEGHLKYDDVLHWWNNEVAGTDSFNI
jgi:hypothetical protein